MSLSSHVSFAETGTPYGRGTVTMVFSSPTAVRISAGYPGVEPPVPNLSHTAWCRWILSVGGMLPSRRVRLGLKRTMYPGP